MTTGARIKAARKVAGMTQAELAAKLGISFQSVAQWENGLRNPKYETLEKIASALEVPISVLIGDFYQLTLDLYSKEDKIEKIATGDIKQLAEQLARTALLAENEVGRLILLDLNNLLDYVCVVNKKISDTNRKQMLEDIDHIITGITNILTGHTLTGENEAWLSLAEEAKSDIDARVNRIYSLSKKLSK